jgi:hypothetical protein
MGLVLRNQSLNLSTSVEFKSYRGGMSTSTLNLDKLEDVLSNTLVRGQPYLENQFSLEQIV